MPEPPAIPTTAAIHRVAPTQLQAALRRLMLFGSPDLYADPRRFIIEAQRAGLDLHHIWAEHLPGGALGATAMMIPQAGRTGLMFISQPRRSRDAHGLAATMDLACREIDRSLVALAQGLVRPDDALTISTYEQAGFTKLATLCYLSRSVPGRGAPPIVPDDVTVQAYDPSLRQMFIDVLERSYESTLDCPGLCGLRRTSDVLAGHMGAGQFDPTMWTLLRMDGEPSGVLLVNPTPPDSMAELVYLGLSPQARGRGLGSMLLRRALWLCAQRRIGALCLAVDESNAPATRLYMRHGFKSTARKTALIRVIERPVASGSPAT